ncbi:MAG: glutathione synthetase, partial [Rhodothermales bacterium]|nr:glutathione synthetase [Rhodothermales bacterium]
MKLALFINDAQTEQPNYASTVLAMTARRMGHEVWYLGVEDVDYDPDETLRARALRVPDDHLDDNEAFIQHLQTEVEPERLDVGDLDVLFLRSNPADETGDRSWAQSVGIQFGQIAVRHGVLVVNDPFRLAGALNKLYFQFFPAEVRPKTLITRDAEAVRRFYDEQDGHVILKPLQGSGGESVFRVNEADEGNLNQMFDAVARDGYVVAQEFLPDAAEGDVRLLLMNGRPLVHEGKTAALYRSAAEGDIRSNIHAGGEAQQAEITDEVLRIAEIVRPKLIQDGMFLVGLDVAGGKLLEVNVFSPGGLWSMERFEKVPFSEAVIGALEEKVHHAERYGRAFSNAQLA